MLKLAIERLYRTCNTMRAFASLITILWSIIIYNPPDWNIRACLMIDTETATAKVVDCVADRRKGDGSHPLWLAPVVTKK
jgi:hypothetical protein